MDGTDEGNNEVGGFIWGKGKQQLRREVPVLVACM